MSFPSAGGTKADDLDTAWMQVRSIANNIKQQSIAVRDASSPGPISASSIVQYVGTLAQAKVALARYTAVPGLAAYVQAQVNSPTLDIVAEYNTMLAQVNATIAWIVANFPHDGSGNLLYQQLDANGNLVVATWTSSVTANLRTALNALIATID